MRRGKEFKEFWEGYFEEKPRQILFILGLGFDPRMCDGLDIIAKACGNSTCDCILIEFDEGQNSPSIKYSKLVSQNKTKLDDLLKTKGVVTAKNVKMWSENGPGRRRSSSRSALELLTQEDFNGYTDIIIDISALPRSIYFPIIGKSLHITDQLKLTSLSSTTLIPNIYVIVSENPILDTRIVKIGIDDNANYIQGFGGSLEMEATSELPKVWIPILGEGRIAQLERIYDYVGPEEICPILPFPSSDPRRSDKLLFEYQNILFDRWQVEMNNISFATEQNPFDIYRQIHRVIRQYFQALDLIGGGKAVVSALSSKVLSIGALLATYELRKTEEMSVGIAHVEAHGYELNEGENENPELYSICLVGDCYDL
jgi:hypothetical protein